MTKPRYLKISWEQFHNDARILASRLVNRKDLKKIICVTRGGLLPAAILARELEIRWVDTICVAGYDEEERGTRASLLKVPETDGEGVLVVDDLVDSGRTGRIIRELMPKAYFVTLYAKPMGQKVVDDFVFAADQDMWILFPWEAELAPATPLVRQDDEGKETD
ncbi:MAG: xanthine phosphoribosyltransferase [Alphaproteobacteria bacterium]|nr:xanthine phosphoribosyltransferase [Alphaproteobacteria bacterium]